MPEEWKTMPLEAISLENASVKIAAGLEHIEEGGRLIVDCSNFRDSGDTAAVCALIEWARTAKQKNCRLSFRRINTRLSKFLRLYQLTDYFAE